MIGKDKFSLQGMNAILTGGAKGLGKVIAQGFMEYGARMILTDKSDTVYKTAEEFRAMGFDCAAVHMDLLNEKQRNDAFDKCLQIFNGKLDILYNNAGIQKRIPLE